MQTKCYTLKLCKYFKRPLQPQKLRFIIIIIREIYQHAKSINLFAALVCSNHVD